MKSHLQRAILLSIFLILLSYKATIASIIPGVLVCDITNVAFGNISSCNDNGTGDPGDDYFTADIKVEFVVPPATGDLRIRQGGDAIGINSIAVGSLVGTSHVFTAVKFKADGNPTVVDVEFTIPSNQCVQTEIGPTVQPCSPGCTNTTQYPSIPVLINPNGNIVTIESCNFAGEYSELLGAVTGQTLKFTSSELGDIITIHSGSPSGPVIAFGVLPLTFLNTFTGNIYAHWNIVGCGSQGTCRTTTVQLITNCILTCPANITTSATAVNGAVVIYPPPTPTGNCGSIFTLPPSGIMFPVGTTQVSAYNEPCKKVYGLTLTNELVAFDVSSPSTVSSPVTITGLQPGETIVGIDIRPADNGLYGIGISGGNTGRVYSINKTTGVATLIGASPFSTTLTGTEYAMDFNPVVDRIRFVTNTGQNMRINPITGALQQADPNLNPGTPDVVGAAYSNNYTPSASTVLFDIDASTDALYTQNPPNNGTLVLVGNLGFNASDVLGFDISQTGIAYASMIVGGVTGLFTINLGTGAATFVGAINSNVRDITVAAANESGVLCGFAVTVLPMDACLNIITLSCGTPATISFNGPGNWSSSACNFPTPGIEQVYSFTPTISGLHSLEVTSASGSFGDYSFKLASDGCSSVGWTCIDVIGAPKVVDLGQLTAGTTYYILFDAEGANGTTSQTFQINCPVDPCANILPLACSTPVTATQEGQGIWSVTDCGFATPGKEKVYSFTPPATGMYTLQVTAVSGTDGYADYFFKAASDGCSPTGWTCIEDFTAPAMAPFGPLTAGTPYYILFDSEVNNGETSQTFQINCPGCSLICSANIITTATGANGAVVNYSPPNSSGNCGSIFTLPPSGSTFPVGITAVNAFNNPCKKVYGLTLNNELVTFNASSPGSVSAPVTITGLQAGETIVGIDFRPGDGLLYGIGITGGNTGRLYIINSSSGVTSLVNATPFSTTLTGTEFAMDVNPFVDRIRFITNTGQNMRINPITGALQGADPNLNPGSPDVVGAAYTNNYYLSPSTVLYDIDANTDALYTQNPPNNGTLVLVGNLGVNAGDVLGFDISQTGVAYASMVVGGVTGLFTIDLATGAATSLGTINSNVRDFTVALAKESQELCYFTVTVNPPAPCTLICSANITTAATGNNGAIVTYSPPNASGNCGSIFTLPPSGITFPVGTTTVNAYNDPSKKVYGLTLSNELVTFDVGSPGIVSSPVTITGLQGGETIVGIDIRPADNGLYGIGISGGNTGRVYSINKTTGVATLIGASPFSTTLTGTEYAMDFNPFVDRIRFVTNTGQNMRINPITGALQQADPNLNPGTPDVVGVAYSNNYTPSASTVLFDIDASTDALYTQNPPNNGTLVLVGNLGFNASDVLGFDISQTGIAYTSMVVGGVTGLFTINLSTGAATFVGAINSNVRDITIAAASESTVACSFTITVTPNDDLCSNITTLVCATPVTTTQTGTGVWSPATCGYATVGQEHVYSFTPTTTGMHSLQVTAASGGFGDYFYKAASDGCDNSDWLCIGFVTAPDLKIFGPLTAGTTYYILFDSETSAASSQTFQINCPSTIDPCTNIPVFACATPVTVSFSGIGAWSQLACGFSTPGMEQIYSFTPTTTGNYILEVLSTSGVGYVDYFYKVATDGCNSTGWNCIDDISSPSNALIGTLTAGTTYYILLDAEDITTVSQTFQINCPPDPCSNITALSCEVPDIVNLNGAGTWNVTSCGYQTPGNERIFSFTPTQTGMHTLEITVGSGDYFDYFYKVASDGCNSTGWTCIGWAETPEFNSFGPLTAGTTYYILVDAEETSNTTQRFQIICPLSCILTCPANISQSADANQCGAVVTYPSATGTCGTISYSPPSGSFFPVGPTTVSATASDGTTCNFVVTVNDVNPPVLQCPPNITVQNDPGQCGAIINLVGAATATDNCGATITYNPASGSFQGLGTITYTATATDASNNTATCTFTVTVNGTLGGQQPGPISGPAGACCGQKNVTYCITPLPGISSYTWTLPNGATAVGSSTGPCITVNLSNSYNGGSICVKGNGGCLPGQNRCMNVPKISSKPSTPGNISGPSSLCPGTCGVFSVGVVNGATAYQWTASSGLTITSGQGTNSIVVCAQPGFASGNVCVYAKNCKGNSATKTKNVTGVPGKPVWCANSSGDNKTIACSGVTQSYAVAEIPGVNVFVWSAPGTAIINDRKGHTGNPLTVSGTDPSGKREVDITFPIGFLSGEVSVYAQNACGNSSNATLLIKSQPSTPGSVSGNASVCKNSTKCYTISSVSGSTSYSWSVNGGATIKSGQGTTNVCIKFNSCSSTSVTLTVKAVNVCGSSATSSKAITVNLHCKVNPDGSFTEEQEEMFYDLLSVYPNPTTGKTIVTFNSDKESLIQLKVVNVIGEVMINETIHSVDGYNIKEINLEEASPGLYLISIQAEGEKVKTLRLIVE